MAKINSSLGIGLGFLLSCLLVQAQASGLYRWVDKDGKVHYADSIPPTASQIGHTELNPLGMAIKNVPAAKTSEQAAEDDWLKKLQNKHLELKERQQQEDRELLGTFTDVKQLDDAYAERVKMLADTRKQLELWLDKLKIEIVDLKAAFDKADDAERKRIQGFIDTKLKNAKEYEIAIQQNLAEEKSSELAFQKQRARFLELLNKSEPKDSNS